MSPRCWFCSRVQEVNDITWGAYLFPRSAGEGGPVFLHRCAGCGTESAVERNGTDEILLSPPHLVGVARTDVSEETVRRAHVWSAEHRAERSAFLARRGSTEAGSTGVGSTKPASKAAGSPPPRGDAEPDAGGREDEKPRKEPPPDEASPRIASPRIASSLIEAYEVLGLPLTATTEEVKRAYREKSKQCHPDRVAGMDEQIRRTAERRFREIRGAYESITGRAS